LAISTRGASAWVRHDADRLARLHQQRLVGLEVPQRRDDAVEVLPGPRRAPDAAVDDQLVRVLGHVGWRLFISIRIGASVSQLLA
jgi:hypothetical protein